MRAVLGRLLGFPATRRIKGISAPRPGRRGIHRRAEGWSRRTLLAWGMTETTPANYGTGWSFKRTRIDGAPKARIVSFPAPLWCGGSGP
jgi:hypothetical protein